MSDSFNPIISKEEIPRFQLFKSRPTPEPGIAFVLFREGHPLATLWPGDRLTAGEARWGNYKVLYKVDVTEHSFGFSCTLPCQHDAFDFHAEVQVTCSVDKPTLIVERNITNIRTVLEPLIIGTMRNVSRNHDVEESASAERAIQKAIEAANYNVGIKLTRIGVTLNLEQDARIHIRGLRELERTGVRVREEAALEKQRDLLAMERMKMKMEFYSPLIQGGQWQLLALQLSNHPEDVAGVMQMLNQERRADLERQLDALKIMIEADALEDFQISEAGKGILQRLVTSFGADAKNKLLGDANPLPAPRMDEDENDIT